VCELENVVVCDFQGNIIDLDLGTTELWIDFSPEISRQLLNQLTSLPPEIGQLTHLRYLSLSHSSLTSLPPEIGQLTHLQELYLYGNPLTSLPPEIGQLTNLQELDLSDNQLASLPPEIGQLTNLQTLYLDGNPMTSLPPELCAKLKDVRIRPSSLCP
jgi:Leucine-rich repeat (LRR) protein